MSQLDRKNRQCETVIQFYIKWVQPTNTHILYKFLRDVSQYYIDLSYTHIHVYVYVSTVFLSSFHNSTPCFNPMLL